MSDTNPETSFPHAVQMGTELYRNIRIGSDMVLHILPHVQNHEIKTDLTSALNYYDGEAEQVKHLLSEKGGTVREEGPLSKLTSRAEIVLNTAVDSTDSHIAEMLMEGCQMGVSHALKLEHEYREYPECRSLCGIARNLAAYEEKHIDRLKQFL